VDKYIPLRVGPSERERIEIEQSGDALVRKYDQAWIVFHISKIEFGLL
jgi:hypothetical protein